MKFPHKPIQLWIHKYQVERRKFYLCVSAGLTVVKARWRSFIGGSVLERFPSKMENKKEESEVGGVKLTEDGTL